MRKQLCKHDVTNFFWVLEGLQKCILYFLIIRSYFDSTIILIKFFYHFSIILKLCFDIRVKPAGRLKIFLGERVLAYLGSFLITLLKTNLLWWYQFNEKLHCFLKICWIIPNSPWNVSLALLAVHGMWNR